MFVRLKSGTIINVDRINHIELVNPEIPKRQMEKAGCASYLVVATCWFYKGVGERLLKDDLDNVLYAIAKGPGLL